MSSMIITVNLSNVEFSVIPNGVSNPVSRERFIETAPVTQRLLVGSEETLAEIVSESLNLLSINSQFDYMSADLDSIQVVK